MSNTLEFRRAMRNRKRKQRLRRNIFLSIVSLIIITVLVIAVKSIFSNISAKREQESEFIFNGYVYPQPPKKNTDLLIDAVKKDDKKVAYLTFDDGPNNSVTLQVLDVLRRYNVKATFFMVGSLIEKNPDVARRIYEEGHLLANHSYTHNYSELYANKESFMSQVDKTEELIYKITCDDNYPRIFRFPGGGHNGGSYGALKQSYKNELENKKYRFCDWNALSGDAEEVSPSEEYVLQRVKTTTKNKEDVVLLMHDAPAKSVTPKTLPEVIEYLIMMGYNFDTLDNI